MALKAFYNDYFAIDGTYPVVLGILGIYYLTVGLLWIIYDIFDYLGPTLNTNYLLLLFTKA